MMRRGVLILLAAIVATTAFADGIRPVTVRIAEQETDRFLVRVRAPKQLPPRAIPAVVLPESCRAAGEPAMTDRADAWIARRIFVCPEGIAGRDVRIVYPFVNVAVSTLLRIERIDGSQDAHLLQPGEDSWRVPATANGEAPEWMRGVAESVRHGAIHFVSNIVHVLFLSAVVLLGGSNTPIRLATAFTGGQVVAVVLAALLGVRVDTVFGEIAVAVAAVLLAREALRPAEVRRQLTALAASAGIVHGVCVPGLVDATDGPVLPAGLASVLGMDAALLLSAAALLALGRLVSRRVAQSRLRTAWAYVVAGLAFAVALSGPPSEPATTAGESAGGLRLEGLSIPPGGASSAGSRRVAARVPDAVLQSFVTVDAYEVRHEVLVRVAGMADRFELDRSSTVEVEDQDDLARRVLELVTRRTSVTIDGQQVERDRERVDFLTIDAQGALPRRSPVPEPVAEAWLGVTLAYPTSQTPRTVRAEWSGLDDGTTIPATWTDPESSRTLVLTAASPALRWKNELEDDPVPAIRATTVEPATWWVPFGAFVPLGGAALFGWSALRGRRRAASLALVRVLVAVAAVLAPVAGRSTAVPFSATGVPSADRTARILAVLLPNVYRAFESPSESATYDRLSLSVTGDTLTDVYLEQRRAVTMEERGGARARVEAVEVVEVGDVEAGATGGFAADAVWTVGGTVTHFGHRHFRQNRYDARLEVVPVDGVWKIRAIDVRNEERLR